MQLRKYQQQAIQALLASQGNALVVLSAGAGKSLVISELARLLNTKVLIFAPSAEITMQNHSKLSAIVPIEDIGIYSASCGEKDIKKFTLATILSVYKKPELFKDFGVVIIDEVHNITAKDTGAYRTFLKAIGNPRLFGFSATPCKIFSRVIPFRPELWKKTGRKMFTSITETRLLSSLPKPLFSSITFNIPMKELQEQGYLSPLEYFDNSKYSHKEIPLLPSGQNFDMEKFAEMILPDEERILDVIIRARDTFGSVLVFCPTVETAIRFSETLKNSAVITADTKQKVREQTITDFKSGKISVCLNFGTLTTGFDYESLGAIVNLRPVRSVSLWVQMCGRVTRISPKKEKGVIIDMSGTYKTLGKIEDIVFDNNGVWIKGKNWDRKVLYSFKLE